MASLEIIARCWLVVGFLITLAGCGGSTRPAPNSAASSASVLDVADVERDADGEPITLTLFNAAVSDDGLAPLGSMPKLREFTLQQCDQISGAGFASLKEATQLARVKLIRVPVTDEALQHLAGITSLGELHLSHTSVTGAGLRHLSGASVTKLVIHSHVVTAEGLSSLPGLTSLRELELHCPRITLADLPLLAPLENLESFIAAQTPLGKSGVAQLRGLTALKVLKLDSEALTDAAISDLNSLTNLERLEVPNAALTDDALSDLSLPNLRYLSLSGCEKITDVGLGNLQGCPQLEELNLSDSAVKGRDLTGLGVITTLREVIMSGDQFKGNDQSIKALRAILPECEVVILRG